MFAWQLKRAALHILQRHLFQQHPWQALVITLNLNANFRSSQQLWALNPYRTARDYELGILGIDQFFIAVRVDDKRLETLQTCYFRFILNKLNELRGSIMPKNIRPHSIFANGSSQNTP